MDKYAVGLYQGGIKWDERLCKVCRGIKSTADFRFCEDSFRYSQACLACEAEEREKQQEEQRTAEEARKEKQRRKNREWRARNPEKAKAALLKLQSRPADPLKRKERDHRRRARKQQAKVGKVSLKRILVIHGRVCYLCGEEIPKGELHFEHVIPLWRGGEHSEENIRPACARCNLKKGRLTAEEYLAQRA